MQLFVILHTDDWRPTEMQSHRTIYFIRLWRPRRQGTRLNNSTRTIDATRYYIQDCLFFFFSPSAERIDKIVLLIARAQWKVCEDTGIKYPCARIIESHIVFSFLSEWVVRSFSGVLAQRVFGRKKKLKNKEISRGNTPCFLDTTGSGGGTEWKLCKMH